MKKTLMKVYLWLLYIISAPLIVLWIVGWTIYGCIRSVVEFGEFDIRGVVGAIVTGIREGHSFNMYLIDQMFPQEAES